MRNNLSLLETAAERLESLLPHVVFVGGATLDLLVTDDAAAPIRITDDVDVVVEIATYVDYLAFSERLRKLGFSEDSSGGAPICRFLHGDLKLDVMPVDARILGFANCWYKDTVQLAQPARLPSGRSIRLITAPCFLGTKMEAFHQRGQRDYLGSHDLEDFITVVDARPELLEELASTLTRLRNYLGEATGELLAKEGFREALYGFVLGDPISQQRVPILLERLQAISKMT